MPNTILEILMTMMDTTYPIQWPKFGRLALANADKDLRSSNFHVSDGNAKYYIYCKSDLLQNLL